LASWWLLLIFPFPLYLAHDLDGELRAKRRGASLAGDETH